MDTLTIDLNKVTELAREGGKFVFKKDAEEAILQLLELRDLVEERIAEVARSIEDAGLGVDASFSGVVGTRLTAQYRSFGEKYSFDAEMREALLSAGFVKENKTYKVVSEDVDSFFKKNKDLPPGIRPKERQPKISFSKRKDKLSKLP